jgi:hypothetical protein
MVGSMSIAKSVRAEILNDMVGARNVLLEGYDYFVHETEKDSLRSIRKDGLTLFRGTTPSTEVIEKFGADYRGYVCLHPVGSDLDPKARKIRLLSALL